MSQQPLAYENLEFLDSNEARPVRLLSEYLEPLKRFKARRSRTRSCFRVGARRQPRAGERALQTLKARGVHGADAHYQEELQKSRKALEWAKCEDARTRPPADDVEPDAAVGASPLVVTSGGGRASWRRPTAARTRRRENHRPQHPAAVRAGRQSVHHRRSALRVPLLLHAQVLVRVLQSLVIFPGGFGTSTRCSRF
jgi:hypothetical protein